MVIEPKAGSRVAGLAAIEKFYVDLLMRWQKRVKLKRVETGGVRFSYCAGLFAFAASRLTNKSGRPRNTVRQLAEERQRRVDVRTLA